MSLLAHMRQDITAQANAANRQALAGYRLLPSLPSTVYGIFKTIRRLCVVVRKAADIANLKALGGLRHGTEETQEHR